MKMVHKSITREVEWNENQHVWEIIVENPAFLRRLYRDLSGHQLEDSDINFISEGKNLKLNGDLEVIFNPLKLDFNNRKAITALLKILVKTSSSEEFYVETNEIKSKVIRYLDGVVDAEDFLFEVDTEEFLVDALAKAVNMHIVGDEDNYPQLLTEYLSMMSELVNTKLFVIFNLRSVVNDDELRAFVENLQNLQIDVLLIENVAREKISFVDRVIIDQDMCEI